MAAGSESLQGPRLEFVLKEIPGTVKRTKHKAPPTKLQVEKNPELAKDLSNQKVEVEEPAGYMLYLPTGFCYRLTYEEVVRRKFDRQPNILSFEQANNTSTPAGRFKLARSDAERKKAMEDMEKQIIDACRGRQGKVDGMLHEYNPTGKLVELDLEAA